MLFCDTTDGKAAGSVAGVPTCAGAVEVQVAGEAATARDPAPIETPRANVVDSCRPTVARCGQKDLIRCCAENATTKTCAVPICCPSAACATQRTGSVLNSLTFIIFAEKNDETLSPNSLSILQSG